MPKTGALNKSQLKRKAAEESAEKLKELD